MLNVQEMQALLDRIGSRLDAVTRFIITSWSQPEEGAWSLHWDGNESSVEATALAVLWLLRSTPEGYHDLVTKGLDFLVHAQHKNGAWPTLAGPDQESDPTSTAQALLALVRYTAGAKKNRAEKDKAKTPHTGESETAQSDYDKAMRDGQRWLTRYLQPRHPSAHTNYWICTALDESQDIGRLYKSEIAQDILPSAEYRVELLSHDGAWGERPKDPPNIVATAYYVYMLIKVDPDSKAVKEGIAWLKEHWNPDVPTGPWSPVETNARVIIALLAAGEDPEYRRSGQAAGSEAEPGPVAQAAGKDAEYCPIVQAIQHLLEWCDESQQGWSWRRHGKPDMVATHCAFRALKAFETSIRNKQSEQKFAVVKANAQAKGQTR